MARIERKRFTTHLTESQCSSCYDLPGSHFEVPFQSGLDSFRADGFVKHRIEGPSTPEIAKLARPFADCSGPRSRTCRDCPGRRAVA